ncbi:MAG: hypothetical protein LBF34_02555 [Puniceicoccales bacterium]|jgi:hypothetical protein|nr:hypothetical protein [Puniceicoccales bacterium]
MKKGIHILKELCCGLALLSSTVVTVSGAVDILDFLTHPDILREVEDFSQAVRGKLNFPGRINPARIEAWRADPTHQRREEHPLRVHLRHSLSNDIFYSRFLMPSINIILDGMNEVIHSVPIAAINSAFETSDRSNRGKPKVHVVLGLPVESLQHWEKANGAIVQVASQFNALESTTPDIALLPTWVNDPTQGPGACLQALTATALRCAAQERWKLPDALLPLLEGCVVERQPILHKYPLLYRNGYWNLFEIQNLANLSRFANYIEANIGQLRIQAQWVRCEESGTTQLQVFSAAPAFVTEHIDWNETDGPADYFRRISTVILCAQYEALAQMARLSRRSLHLTAVGMGTFNNPPEAFNAALGAALRVLEGSGIEVFLHGYSLGDIEKWNRALASNGYEPVRFNPRAPGFSPIAQTQKMALPPPNGLAFFSDPYIPEAFEQFSSDVRRQLGFAGVTNPERIAQWRADPTHQRGGEHPLRASIRQFLDRRHAQLMDLATQTFDGMREPVVSAFSLEDIDHIQEPSVHVVLGLPIESLQHWENADGAIVQVASQFNGVESDDPIGTYLPRLVGFRSQGPGACMQALSAAALRRVAHERRQFPDAILPLIEGCTVGGQPIRLKYRNLYLNSLLRPSEISNLEDLQHFTSYIEKNAKKLKIPTQWVRCEESGITQLQVFCAAPFFPTQSVNWNSTDERTNCFRRISIALLCAQYEALAKMARLSRRSLHLTAIGMGVVNNPSSVLGEAVRAALKALEGSTVAVYLHGYSLDDTQKWDQALESNGYEPVRFNPGAPGFSPIVRTRKK